MISHFMSYFIYPGMLPFENFRMMKCLLAFKRPGHYRTEGSATEDGPFLQTGSVSDVGYYLIQYSMCCITDRPFSTVAPVPGLFLLRPTLGTDAPPARSIFNNKAEKPLLGLGNRGSTSFPQCNREFEDPTVALRAKVDCQQHD